ncbi:hypothetical protein BGY98DRAFT_387324 [Russula aff. rugulosa BPL654]|nr:hypothetical protein BGY98DRAFT_387324 [Russula aff. rugulosa BPL654]
MVFFFLMMFVTAHSHFSTLNLQEVPAKTTRRKYFAKITRRADSEVNYVPTSRAKGSSRVLLAFVTDKSSECCVLLYHWQDHRTPASGSVSASDGPPPLARQRAIQRVWPRVFSVDETTTSIQIRLPEAYEFPSLREWPFPLPPLSSPIKFALSHPTST